MIKALIFDLDDTLYSEWTFIKQGFWAAANLLHKDFKLDNKYSTTDIYNALVTIFRNIGRVRIFNQLERIIPEIKCSEFYICKTLVPAFRFSKKNLQCYPDVIPALNRLKDNFTIGMVTNGDVNVQENKIELLSIRKYFDKIEVSGNYSAQKAKPSTYMLKKLLNSLQLRPAEALYIGDNLATDRSAITIGCSFIKIERHDGLYKEERDSNPQYPIIYNLSSLQKFL